MRWVSTWLAAGVFAAALLLLSRVVAEPPPIEQVKQALQRQESWLAKAPTGPGWNQYLQIDQLKQQLGKGPDADRASILEVLGKYRTDPPGLKMPLFSATRKALEAWDVALTQKSLMIQASKQIVEGGIHRIIDRDMQIHECILGTDVHSLWAHTNANITSTLVPSDDRAVIQVDLNGQTHAKTVGYHGRVTIYSHSTTSLEGHKQIILDENAVSSLAPWANCCTHTSIDCLDICGGRIVQRIATRRVYGSLGAAQAEAAKRAEVRVRDQMEQEVGSSVANANKNYQDKFRSQLLRKDAFPQPLTYSTNKDWLKIVALQPAANGIGAIPAPPDMLPADQLSMRVHESLVNSYGDVIVPNRKSREMQYWRGVKNYYGKPYNRAEFIDLLKCLAETGAPDKEYDDNGALQVRPRDEDLVVKFDDFSRLMKNRYWTDKTDDRKNISEQQFDAITHAMYDDSIGPNKTHFKTDPGQNQRRYDKFLAQLADPQIPYADAVQGLRYDQSNYSAVTFAERSPIDVRFHNDQGEYQIDLTLRLKSSTFWDARKKEWVTEPYPCEVYTAYKMTMRDGTAYFDRIGGKYGIKSVAANAVDDSAPAQADGVMDRRRRLNEALMRKFFGTKGAADGQAADSAPPGSEPEPPVFPERHEDRGLPMHTRMRDNLGEVLPWSQLECDNGWMAMGWKIAGK